MVRKHPLFTLSLLIVGILIGYGSSIPEQRLGRISYGKIGYRDLSNAELKQKATQVKAPVSLMSLKNSATPRKTIGDQALVIWYFPLRSPGRWMRGFLLKNFLSHTEPEKHIIKADTSAQNSRADASLSS